MALAHQPLNILRVFVASFMDTLDLRVLPLVRRIVILPTCRHFLLLPGHFREIPGRLSQIPGHFFQNVLNPVLREILQVSFLIYPRSGFSSTAIMWSWPGTDRGRTPFFRVGRRKQEGMPDFGPDFWADLSADAGSVSGNRFRTIAVRNKKPPAWASQ
jgi:hypothetical protein